MIFYFIIVLVSCNVIGTDVGLEIQEVDTCEKKPNDLYPMRDCTKYMNCTNEQRTTLQCPHGHIYKADKKECILKTEMTLEIYCIGRPNGDYMFPFDDCHKFVHCLYGWNDVLNCENEHFYDPTVDECRKEASADFCVLSANDQIIQLPKNQSLLELTGYDQPSNQSLTNQSMVIHQTVTIPPTAHQIFTTDSQISQLNNTNQSQVEGYNADEEFMNDSMNLLSDNNNVYNQSDVDLITPEELKIKLQLGEVKLIDVRESWEIRSEGRIAQSNNIPVRDIKSALQLDEKEFKKQYNFDKPLQDDCNIVFYCRSGVRGWHALQIAKSLGYKCAKNLKGGFNAWKEMLP